MTCTHCQSPEVCKTHAQGCIGVPLHDQHPMVACQCKHCVDAFFQRHHDADIQDFLRRK